MTFGNELKIRVILFRSLGINAAGHLAFRSLVGLLCTPRSLRRRTLVEMEGLPRPAGLVRRRSTKAIPIVCPACDLPAGEAKRPASGTWLRVPGVFVQSRTFLVPGEARKAVAKPDNRRMFSARQTRDHSPCTFFRPRTWNRRNPRTTVIQPFGASYNQFRSA